MVGETPVTVLGTVISDVTVKRVGENEHELATFLLRASERKFDREKAGWYDHRHFSIRVKCWRKLAVSAHAVLRKGDPVIVTGRLFISDFETAEGQPRSVPEVEAWAIGPNLLLCKASIERDQSGGPGESPAQDTWRASLQEQRNPQVEAGEPMAVA
jgi:single-strand DNA-binding protein